MFNRAYQTVKKYNMLQVGDCIVIGISGGADSVSLFHFLYSIEYKYNLKLIAVHINHCIRGKDADEDAEYVKNLCIRYNVPVEIFKCDIKKEAKKLKITEEEAGRIKRYEIFQNVLQQYNADKIAVAHNMNDQAETILMRICRGTGLTGLSGIQPVRDNIIRPLIECSREDIEKYCIDNNLNYRDDFTNSIDIYTRNKIRLQLIPWIQENLNSSIVKTISSMASILQQENLYMQQQSFEAYQKCIVYLDKTSIKLDIDILKCQPNVIQNRVIRIALQNLKNDLHDIENNHILSIVELIDRQSGKKINITNRIIAQKQYNILYLYIDKIESVNYCYDIKLNQSLYIKEAKLYIVSKLFCVQNFVQKPNNLYTKVFDYDKIGDNIKIRTRQIGDKIYLKGTGSKKIKDYFIDIKLPQQLRNTTPLLAVNNDIIWILGYRVSGSYNVDKSTKNILSIEYKFQED